MYHHTFSIFFVLFLTERLLIKISKIAGLVKSFVQLYFSSGKKRKILFENFVWKNRLNEFVRFFKFVQTNGNIIHEQSTSFERFYIIIFLFFSFAFENNSFFISLKIQVVNQVLSLEVRLTVPLTPPNSPFNTPLTVELRFEDCKICLRVQNEVREIVEA